MKPSEVSSAPHVLVADDSAHNLRIVGEILAREVGCELSFATDGYQTLDSIREIKPDLVLLDIMMPGLSGMDVCAELKKDPATANIPILFLTAKSDVADIIAGFQQGGADYLTKPFNHLELVARVKTHLQITQSAKLVAQKNAELRRLLQILCHDLANPIGALHGFFELCRDDREPFLDAWDELASTTSRAMDIVNFVREMQGLEEGRYNLRLTDFALESAVGGAENNVGHLFKAKEIRFAKDVPKGLCLLAEPISFTNSVLSNLLSNAGKFTKRGGAVHLRAMAEPDGFVRIEVRDEGIGMNSKMVEGLFLPGSKVSRRGTEDEGSTGFGMQLVHKFVESYGGRIAVESRDIESHPDNHGTVVTLWLRGQRT